MAIYKQLTHLASLALGAAILLAACAPPAPRPTQPPPDDSGLMTLAATANAGVLENTKWKLVEVNGSAIPAGVEATIAFAGGKMTGRGGCNYLGGGYQVNGGTIIFSEVASTLMACDDTKMQVENTVLEVLRDQDTFRLAGDALTLTGSQGKSLTFAPQ